MEILCSIANSDLTAVSRVHRPVELNSEVAPKEVSATEEVRDSSHKKLGNHDYGVHQNDVASVGKTAQVRNKSLVKAPSPTSTESPVLGRTDAMGADKQNGNGHIIIA